MQKSPLLDQLAEARLELSRVDELSRHLYTNGTELEKLFAKAQNVAVIRLQLQSGGNPCNTSNAGTYVLSEARGSAMGDIATLAAMVDALNESDDYAQAQAVCQPLVDKIGKLESEIEAERRAESQKLADIEAKRKAAIEKAMAQVEKQFATA